MIKILGFGQQRECKDNRNGSALIELVTAIAISSVLVLGLHSCLIIALKSIPDSSGVAATTIQAHRLIDQMITELETAIYVSERTATVIAFTVPDRNGDGIAERVRYAWTGIPGGPLTRQYNGGTAEIIATQVQLLSLTPSYKSVAEAYPSIGVEDTNESLLIDCYGISGLGNNDVRIEDWVGQYFTLTLPAGSYAWRPTRVQLMVKKNSSPGTSLVQLRPASINLAPANTVLEQYSLLDSQMTTTYAWKSYNFTTIDPLPSGGAICLTVQHQTGSKAVTVQSTSTVAGLQKTGDSGTSWDYDNGKCLVSQLFGKLTRSGGTQSVNSKYLTSMTVALQMTATTPTIQSSTVLLNHPEMLSTKWELQFNQNPTTTDGNGDGTGDWVVNGGGAFNMASIVNGVWQTSSTLLNTNPGNDFNKTTIVDLKFNNTTVGGNGATFAINAFRSGFSCAPILANLRKQTNGTQTLTISTKLNDTTPKTLLNITGLSSQPINLHLIINPSTSSVGIVVNDVQQGTYVVTPFASADGTRVVSIGGNGSTAEFSYARIRVLEE